MEETGRIERGRRRYIFLSFKTEEHEAAGRLKDALRAEGFDVWWQKDIQTGGEWHGELDRALAQAGCAVVLWSMRSMASPWVRHEASQAIARGNYAPARIDPIAIESPYNRIQATDLIGWDGVDRNHPGFRNLVSFILTLIPPPIPIGRRAAMALRAHAATIGALGFAAASILLLWQLSTAVGSQVEEQRKLETALQGQVQEQRSAAEKLAAQLSRQETISAKLEAQQAGIAHSVERSLHPLGGFKVDLIVELGGGIPAVDVYKDHIRKAIADRPPSEGHDQILHIVVTKATKGVDVAIFPPSPLWPSHKQHSDILRLMRDVNVGMSFTAPTSAGYNSVMKSALTRSGADLVLRLGASSRNWAIRSLRWNATTDTLAVVFMDEPPQTPWSTSRRIVSVPDIESATMEVSFERSSRSNPKEKMSAEELERGQQFRLHEIFFYYSGRAVKVRGADMAEHKTKDGLRRYTISMNSPRIERLRQ